MTTIIDGTAGITFPNSTVQASAGQVLQVVNGSTSTQVTNVTSTLVDTGLTATITPRFSTSKILVLVSQAGCNKSSANADAGINLVLLRNATQISTIGNRILYTNSTLNLDGGSQSTNFLDSPATTSATTYKTQFSCWNSPVATVAVQAASGNSTITLMEIAA